MIPFNKPYLSGNELLYIADAVKSGKISGNGNYTKHCQTFFEGKYGFKKCLLTTSCTDALEMAAMLCDIESGDEVIIPSFTFVSTALAFVRQGAKIVFADSQTNHPNIDADKIEDLITPKTKVIVVVHYAGNACEMDKIMILAEKYNLLVVEDAAQAVDSYYLSTNYRAPITIPIGTPKGDLKKHALGSIGHFATFSFHETKNINAGEGGMLVINDERYIQRAEVIWEKGTNRVSFFRGETNKYSWVDTGSSFLPSELTAAYLWGQIENLDRIQNRRIQIWNSYYDALKPMEQLGYSQVAVLPEYSTNNAHLFYILLKTVEDRTKLIDFLKSNGVLSVFHYQSLHKSPYYEPLHDGRLLQNADKYSDCLVRLPLFYELTDIEIDEIINAIKMFYNYA